MPEEIVSRIHITYSLFCSRNGSPRTLRIGKGTVRSDRPDDVKRYLIARYPCGTWTHFRYNVHFTESASLKAERRKITGYKMHTGNLPPWNSVSGGGGRQVTSLCRKVRADGSPCENGALPGNYGFCGVHR